MASFTLQAACVTLGQISSQHHQQIRMVYNLFSSSAAAAAGSTAGGNSSLSSQQRPLLPGYSQRGRTGFNCFLASMDGNYVCGPVVSNSLRLLLN